MCRKFILTQNRYEIIKHLKVNNWSSDFEWQPSFNIKPTNRIPVLTYINGKNILVCILGFHHNSHK